MPGPAEPPRSFVEILERVWWRLDRALDEESVYLSAPRRRDRGRALRHDAALRPPLLARRSSGDRSPRCDERSRRWACARCSATRRPTATASRGVTPGSPRTGASWRAGRPSSRLGMLGAHASFTLSDESLDRLSAAIRDAELEPPRPRGRGPRRRRALLRAPRVRPGRAPGAPPASSPTGRCWCTGSTCPSRSCRRRRRAGRGSSTARART